jgi:predicted nucleic acid-binding protein
VGRLNERLAEHAIIGLDTSVFIYHLEAHPTYQPLTQELLEGVQSGQWQAVTSTITIMELTIPAWRQSKEAVARQYEALLANYPHLTIAPVTRDVARRAAKLRARFNLRPPGALQVAACFVEGATVFVTNDRTLARLHPVENVVILDDYVSSKKK